MQFKWVVYYPGVPPKSIFTSTGGQGSPLVIDTTTGKLYYLDSTNTVVTPSASTQDHEFLTGLLGGQANEHYHLTEAQHLALTANLQQTVEDIAMPNLTVRWDQDQDPPTYAFIGTADPGASEASAVWRIQKATFDYGDVSITWADGDSNFDNVWANRASLSYS